MIAFLVLVFLRFSYTRPTFQARAFVSINFILKIGIFPKVNRNLTLNAQSLPPGSLIFSFPTKKYLQERCFSVFEVRFWVA